MRYHFWYQGLWTGRIGCRKSCPCLPVDLFRPYLPESRRDLHQVHHIKITETIRSERLTDFIITDDFTQANLIKPAGGAEGAGLKKVIVLHVPVAGVTVHPLVTAVQEAKHCI